MNKEFLEFHVKEILLDCNEQQRQQAIDWIEWYIGTLEKEKLNDK
jgi:hypothetical protein